VAASNYDANHPHLALIMPDLDASQQLILNPRSPWAMGCAQFDAGLLLLADELQDVIDYHLKCEPGCKASAMCADFHWSYSPVTTDVTLLMYLLGRP
jgi:hypothetical protein